MKVLFAINEAAPLYKIGGLGDVANGLPQELRHQNIDVRLALPKHPSIKPTRANATPTETFTLHYNRQPLEITVYTGFLPNSTVPLLLFDEPQYISIDSDAGDKYPDKYAVFSLALSYWLVNTKLNWQPDIVHCHDWHASLVPVILQHIFHRHDFPTLLTIHNLAYQGATSAPITRKLNLPKDACDIISWDQQDNDTNILMEGMLHANWVNTVSPNYAKEIHTPEFGELLNPVIKSMSGRVSGILNGINTEEFNPQTDPHLKHHYQKNDVTQGKLENKRQLQSQLNLPQDDRQTLISFIGRIDVRQKGIDLVQACLAKNTLPPKDCQFVFLGTGDHQTELALHQAAQNNPQVKIITRFDEPLARLIYAASDLMIIPSRFEPCGLIQRIAQRYGTLPVAHAVGGLKDTIMHQKSGFLYQNNNADSLVTAINLALNVISTADRLLQCRQTAMSLDFSWQQAATQYKSLYTKIIAAPASH